MVSVDAKKKELADPYGRAGRSWRPAGDPVKVRGHDFPDEERVLPIRTRGVLWRWARRAATEGARRCAGGL